MSFKVDLSGLKIKLDKLEKAVDNAIDDKLAKDTANQVRKRTQLGYGVDENGKQVKLEPLSIDYKETRKKNKTRLSGNSTPGKSNLTATGQMLKGLTGRAKDNQIFIRITGSRTTDLTGYPSNLSNAEVADFVEEQGRRFMDLTNAEKNQLIRTLRQKILKNMK